VRVSGFIRGDFDLDRPNRDLYLNIYEVKTVQNLNPMLTDTISVSGEPGQNYHKMTWL